MSKKAMPIADQLTDEERARLSDVRDAAIDVLYAELNQLDRFAEHLASPAPSMTPLAVYRVQAAEGQTAPVDSSAMNVVFDHVTIAGPRDQPAGIVLRGASNAVVVRTLVDDMQRQALEDGILTPEFRDALGLAQ